MNYTLKIVINSLKNYAKISELKYYKGDICACDLLVDIDRIVELAALTVKQKIIVERLWKQGLKQCDLAKEMGISQPMIFKHVGYITVKLKRIVDTWNKEEDMDGDVVAK